MSNKRRAKMLSLYFSFANRYGKRDFDTHKELYYSMKLDKITFKIDRLL